MIYESARNNLMISELAYPQALVFLNSFVQSFAKQKHLATANAGNTAALARQATNPIPIGYTIFDTAPRIPSTAEAAAETGSVCKIHFHLLSYDTHV